MGKTRLQNEGTLGQNPELDTKSNKLNSKLSADIRLHAYLSTAKHTQTNIQNTHCIH